MKHVDAGSLPSCPLSTQCQRLVNDLDASGTTWQVEQFAYTDDLRDERLVRQLRAHVYGCPACSAALTQARSLRAQQRALLHDFLAENEGEVPSTTLSILSALRREAEVQESRPQPEAQEILRSLEKITPGPFVHLLNGRQKLNVEQQVSPRPIPPIPTQSSHPLRNVVALATVAAVILAAMGLFDHFTSHAPESANNQIPKPAPVHGGIDGWTSFVVGLTMVSTATFVIYNFDPESGQSIPWYSSTQDSSVSQMHLDGISRDGQYLLYHSVYQSGQTHYATLPATRDLYTLDTARGGDAIWMDDSHMLVADMLNGVFKVDTQTGAAQQVLGFKVEALEFYHVPYLYFVGAATGLVQGALYRVNLNVAHDAPQQLTSSLPQTNYWFSPDGTTIFFASNGVAEQQGIYAMNDDGAHKRMLHAGSAVPVGYAANDALMLIQSLHGKFQLIQLGETPAQKERVVLADIAPGATSLCGPSIIVIDTAICEKNIALAPYGNDLVLHAYYADGAHKLLYDDLTTGLSKTLLPLSGNVDVQLPGWDRVPVPAPASAEALAYALCA